MEKAIKIVFMGVLLTFSLAASIKAQSIVGVWAVTNEAAAGTNAKPAAVTQPRLYFFTKKHYSIIAVTSDTERQAIDASTATADELRKVYVDSFVANAGTYDIKAGRLSLWPSVAKSPTFMRAGSNATMLVKINGKTMTLTSETQNTYPVKNPTTLTLKRVE
jgi:hypothetical protein